LGSSRFQFGVHRATLRERLSAYLGEPVAAFNWGLPAASPLTSLLQWRRLCAAGGRPDLVVVEGLPALLDVAGPLDEIRESILPPAELTGADVALLTRLGAASPRLVRDNLLLRGVPCYGHRRALVTRMARRLLPRTEWSQPDEENDIEAKFPA